MPLLEILIGIVVNFILLGILLIFVYKLAKYFIKRFVYESIDQFWRNMQMKDTIARTEHIREKYG